MRRRCSTAMRICRSGLDLLGSALFSREEISWAVTSWAAYF